jgi:hypothetical protein
VRLSCAFFFVIFVVPVFCFFKVYDQFNEIVCVCVFCGFLGDALRRTILLVLIAMRHSFEPRVDGIVVCCCFGL